MEKHIEALYGQAPRLDEGPVALEPLYSSALKEQLRISELIADIYGPAVIPLLNQYTVALCDEMECEAQHFFREGYLAAKRESTTPLITPAPEGP